MREKIWYARRKMRIKPLKQPNMSELQALIESYNTPLENTQTANFYRFFDYDNKRYFDSCKQWYFVLNTLIK